MTAFPQKAPYETVRETFDFTASLSSGETILIASVVATVYSGTDASPEELVRGAATIREGTVEQLIGNGVLGVVYTLTCTATTTLGKVLSQSALLVIGQDWPDSLITGAPVAEFSATPLRAYPPGSIAFTDESTRHPTGWLWTVTGDGPTQLSYSSAPTFELDSGFWTVQLEAWNIFGTGTEEKEDYIEIVEPILLTLSPDSSDVSGDLGDSTLDSAEIVATSTGGLGGNTYLWTHVSGDTFSLSNPTSATTQVFSSSRPEDDVTYSGVYRCTVTDSGGHSAHADVTITQEWVLGIHYITFNPASLTGNGVLSNGDLTATFSAGGAATYNTVAASKAIRGVEPYVKVVELSYDYVGAISGSNTVYNGIADAVGYASLAALLTTITQEFDGGTSQLKYAINTTSGAPYVTSGSAPVSGDVWAWAVDFSATNPIMQVYKNGVKVGTSHALTGNYTGSYNATDGATFQVFAGTLTVTIPITVTVRNKPSQMSFWEQYVAGSNATDGWWYHD